MYVSVRGRGPQGAQGAEGAQGRPRALLGLSADIPPQSRGRGGTPGKPGRSVVCPDAGAVLFKSNKQAAVAGRDPGEGQGSTPPSTPSLT